MSDLTLPTEEEVAATKRKSVAARSEALSGSGPGSVPTWKLTRARHVYTLGGLSLALRALARRPAAIAYESVRSLPIMLQVAAQCGIEGETRLDFERAAAILTLFRGEEITPDLASAAWRDFITSDDFADAVGGLADALYPFLDDPHAQGYAWPRPIQESPTEDMEASLAAYEGRFDERENIVR